MVGNPEDRLSGVDAHLSVCLNSRGFLIVLNKRTISGDKVCFKRFECRYMSSVSLTERSMSVLLHVFRYIVIQVLPVPIQPKVFRSPQRSCGVKKPEQRSVSHRLGPDFITMKPKI